MARRAQRGRNSGRSPAGRRVSQSTVGLLAIPAILAVPHAAPAQQSPIDATDLVAFRDVVELDMAADGRRVVFVARTADVDADEFHRAVYTADTGGRSEPTPVPALDDATSIRWTSDGRLSFLAARNQELQQVWSAAPDGTEPRRETDGAARIESYAWSPDGRYVAYTVMEPAEPSSPTSFAEGEGVVVAELSFNIYRILTDDLVDRPERTTLWLMDREAERTWKVFGDRSVQDFAWSPDGRRLAIVARPEGDWWYLRTDLVVHDVAARSTRVLVEGRGAFDYQDAFTVNGPAWSPDGTRIAFFGTDRTDRWSGIARIGIYDLRTDAVRYLERPPDVDFYLAGLEWLRPDALFLSMGLRARNGLFAVDPVTGTMEPLLYGQSYMDDFAFSADGLSTAWIQQSTSHPPEVQTARWPFERQNPITSLNSRYAALRLPTMEEVEWPSTNGATIQGWLLEPVDRERPHPLLVVIHGGPGVAVMDRFWPYWAWPYPAQLFTQRGYAIFYPNYRGTGTFGKSYREPPGGHQSAPVDDVVTGVRALIDRGIASSSTTGIMGQSHGAWLGPLVVNAAPDLFGASSFAEGAADWLSLYGHMPGWLNVYTHEMPSHGGNPYDDIQSMIALSPVFGVGRAGVPMLLEYGQLSGAPQGLEYLTALWRHGVPSELVIYPQTGHNLEKPRMMRESMLRNLDWFEFWLRDAPPGDLTVPARYGRWLAMKSGDAIGPEWTWKD